MNASTPTTVTAPQQPPQRIQLRRTAGWRMPAGTVKCDRSTRWGNPFHTHGDGVAMAPEVAAALFERQLAQQGGYTLTTARRTVHVTVADIRRELAGRNLACWCTPGAPCHVDVLLRVANTPSP